MSKNKTMEAQDSEGFFIPVKRHRGRPKKKETNGETSTHNQFNELTDVDDSFADDDMSIASGSSMKSTKSAKTTSQPAGAPKKPKPIKIETNELLSVQQIKNFIDKLQLKSDYRLKISPDKNVQLNTNCLEDKKAVIDALKMNNGSEANSQIPFYSYTEPSEKHHIFVLKNHFYVPTDEILGKLKDMKLNVINVSFLSKNQAKPIYLVHFPKDSMKLQTLNQQFKVIDNLVVKWMKLNKAKKSVTQCYNCQNFGHASKSCGLKHRCVKCTESHLPGQCQRKTREGSAQCVNCQGNHPANHQSCKFFIDYKEKITRSKPKKPMVRYFDSTPAPWASQKTNPRSSYTYSQQDFPKIISQDQKKSHQRSQDTNFIDNNEDSLNIFSLQNDFDSINNIKETMKLFKNLIVQLKSTDCHKTRIGFLLQYVAN